MTGCTVKNIFLVSDNFDIFSYFSSWESLAGNAMKNGNLRFHLQNLASKILHRFTAQVK